MQGNKHSGLVITGLLLGILIAAMDNTIVATAMGTIVSKLGGLSEFAWVTSAYLVAQMAGTPIFGKLSDMYGRKRFFVFGIIVFLLGSILCGTSQSITQLIVYRVIQGIGGGALVPIAFTIVFDIYPPERRGKMTGLFGAVFGTSSIFGPLLGAYITQYISWHWIFYINVPIGIVSLLLILSAYHESFEHRKQNIDWWGATTLVGAIVCLMVALELGGNQYAWSSAVILGLFAGFALLFISFTLIELRVSEPVIAFKMFKDRLFATSTLIGLFYGGTFVVATVYIPIFIQGVLGGSATNSGLLLLPMTLGSVVAAQVGGFLATKLPYRSIMAFSGVVLVVGVLLLGRVSPNMTRLELTLYMIVVGLGVGFSFSVLSMAAVHNFDFRRRGSANSTMQFVRTLGMTLGISIFGILQRNLMNNNLKSVFAGMHAPSGTGGTMSAQSLLSPAVRSHIPPVIRTKLASAISSSIGHTFEWLILPAAAALIIILFMGGTRIIARTKTGVPNPTAE